MNLQNEINSEVFSNSYCIFFDENSLNNVIKKVKEYDNESIKIIQGTFGSHPLCVVIPNSENFQKIERELFEIKENNSGLWGQYGIGYSGKTWKTIK